MKEKVPVFTKAIKTVRILFFLLTSIFFVSCGDEEKDQKLTFIGDSEVARWDVKYFFPSYFTENKGISGAGIADIENMEGAAQESYAVIILGTNNIRSLSMEELPAYAERYIAGLKNLKGTRTFLFSIFPRSFAFDPPGMNAIIKALNIIIKEKCQAIPSFTYLDVYEDLVKGDGINPEYSYDGLHLSKQGYEMISWILKKELK